MTPRPAVFRPPARIANAVVELLGGGAAEIPEWLANDYEPSLGSSTTHGEFVALRCVECGIAFAFRRGTPLKGVQRLALRNHVLAHRVTT